jgi:hypothetical protein
MSVLYLPGVPDWAIAQEMTVYTNPLWTEIRYRPGLEGLAASLPRLEVAVARRDWQSTASAFGDMAACLGIEAANVPLRDPDFGSVSVLLGDLEDAVQAGPEPEAREILRDMLEAMGLTRTPRANRFAGRQTRPSDQVGQKIPPTCELSRTSDSSIPC